MVDKGKFAEEEAQGYSITVVGRHVQVTEAMKNYAWDKLSKIERFHNHIMHVQVTMDIQKMDHSVVIILKFDNFKIKVSASSTDMYASIDKAVDKLQAQVRRWKSKIQDYHNKGLSVVDMQINVLERPYSEEEEFSADIEAETQRARMSGILPAKVIGNDTRPLKTLMEEEALMKMELSGDNFLIYRDEKDQKLKVIYRRSDGNYGIIKPE